MEGVKSGVRLGGVFELVCRGPDGKIKWRDTAPNLVTTQGLQHILDTEFTGSSQVSTWYVGLTDDSPTPAAGDTLASHGSWTEFDEYTGDRKEWDETRSSQTLSNSASVASFAITGAGGGEGGAFLCSAASGTSGTLMSVAALSGGNRAPENGDTVEVTYTFSASDDGS